MKGLSFILACLITASGTAVRADEPDFETIFSRSTEGGPTDWANYLADDASASVTAAGILDIAGESVGNVQNVRDLVVALKGFSSSESKGTLAFSITPARTSLTPMSLSTYANSLPARLLGSLTLGYAQGDAELSEVKYERRAVSGETSFFFNREEDPVLAYAFAVENAGPGDDCAILLPTPPLSGPATPSDTPETSAPEALPSSGPPGDGALAPARPASERAEPTNASDANRRADSSASAVVPAVATDTEAQDIHERASRCRETTESNLRWNRSQFSVSYGLGWIKAKDGGRNESLGRTLVVGLTYGFDQVPKLKERLALGATYRQTNDEPVLETLQNAAVDKRNSSLTAVRLTYGSSKVRALAEVSDSRSRNITASQRAFKKALGLDIRIYEATWLNFRFGEQRTIDGADNEYGSLFTITYSPSALIK